MNRQALERLLTDRAAGELSDDVEELLAAYLAKDAAAAKLAEEFRSTADLAARALAREPARELPPFPAERIRQARQRPSKRIAWPGLARRGLALAASALLGLGAGWIAFRQAAPAPVEGPARVVVQVVERAVPVPAARPPEGDVAESEFWSAGFLAKRAARRPRADSARLMWSSPVEIPTIGGGL